MKKHIRIIYSVLLIVSIVCMFLPIARFEDDRDSDIWRRIERADAKLSEIFTAENGAYNRQSKGLNEEIDNYYNTDPDDAKAQKAALIDIQKELTKLYKNHNKMQDSQKDVDAAREELLVYENSEKLPVIYHSLLPGQLPIPDNLENFIKADIDAQNKIVSDSEKNQAYVAELDAILVKITEADAVKSEGNFALATLELEDKIKELPSAVPFDATKVSTLMAEQKQVKSVRDQLDAVAKVFTQKDEQGVADVAKVGKAVQSLIGIEKTQALLNGEDYAALSTIKAQFDLLDAENAVTGQLASVTADTKDFSKVDEAIVKLSKQEAVSAWFESEDQNILLVANEKIAALNTLAGLLAKVPAENAAQAVETPQDLAKAVETLLAAENVVKYFTEEEVAALQALQAELNNAVVAEEKVEEDVVEEAANTADEAVSENAEEKAEAAADEKKFEKFPAFKKGDNGEMVPIVYETDVAEESNTSNEETEELDLASMKQEELQEMANKLKADVDALLTQSLEELNVISASEDENAKNAKDAITNIEKYVLEWKEILDANCEKGELLDTTIERYQKLKSMMEAQLLLNEKLAVVNEKLAATVEETDVVNPWEGLDAQLENLSTILTEKQDQLKAELVDNDFVALNALVADKAAQETEALKAVVPGIEEVVLRNNQQATLDASVAAVVAEVNNVKAMCAEGGSLAAFVASEQGIIDAAKVELERLNDELDANEAIQKNSAFLLDRDVIVKLTANEGIEDYTGLTLDMELINQNKQVYPVQFGLYNVLVWVAFALLVLALVLVWVPGNKIVSKCYTFASFANIIGVVVLCYVVLRLGGIPVGINYSNPIMNSWVVLLLLVPPVIALLMHCSTVTNSKRSMLYVLCTALCVLSLMPFWLMMVNATRNSQQIMGGVSLLPSSFLSHNWGVLQSKNFDVMVGFKNSAIIAFGSTLLSVYFSALTAYGLTVYKFKGSKIMYAIILAIIMIPGQVTGTGFYMFMFQLGWTNSYWPLIIPAIASASTVFFFKQYLEANFQVSLVEAARIDGAGEFYTYNKIVMPIMIPAMATMGIMAVIGSWNNYLTPLMLLSDPTMKTLPMMVKELRGDIYRTEYGSIYLGLTLTALPLIIVYFCFSKYIIAGVAVGGVKE